MVTWCGMVMRGELGVVLDDSSDVVWCGDVEVVMS